MGEQAKQGKQTHGKYHENQNTTPTNNNEYYVCT